MKLAKLSNLLTFAVNIVEFNMKAMENIENLSAFYKHRGLTGRLMSGYNLLEKNIKAILGASIAILLPYAVIMALVMVWLTGNIPYISPNIDFLLQFSNSSLSGLLFSQVLLCLLLFLIGISIWNAVLYGMFHKYSELGCIPSMKIGAWVSLVKHDIWRYMLYVIFVFFFWLIIGAIFYMLASLTVWLWLLLIPVGLYCGVVLSLFPYFYMMEHVSLWDAFIISFRKGTRVWGSTFAIVVLMTLIFDVLGAVCSLPLFVSLIVDNMAAANIVSGEIIDLPSYYIVLKIIAWILCIYGGMLLLLLLKSSLLFQYSSLMSKDKEPMLIKAREELERLKAERERQERERKMFKLDENAEYRPR